MPMRGSVIAEEGEGPPPGLPRKALKVPPYEQILRDHGDLVRQDALQDLLVFPADNLEVTATPRTARTVRSTLPPAEAFARGTSLFVQRCLEFYQKDWSGVRRRYLALSAEGGGGGRTGGEDGGLDVGPAAVEDSTAQFEVDLEGDDGGGSEKHAPRRSSSFNVEPILTGHLEYSRSAAVLDGPGRRDSKGGLNRVSRKLSESAGVGGRLRKAFAVLRFETVQGPLVLELFKDEKRTTLRDRIDLTESSSIELVPSTELMFRLNLPTESVLCLAESAGRCEEWCEEILAEMARWNLPRVEDILRRGSVATQQQATPQRASGGSNIGRGRTVQSMLDELNQPDRRWDRGKEAEGSVPEKGHPVLGA